MKRVRDHHGIVHVLATGGGSTKWDLSHCERFFHCRSIFGYGALMPCPSDEDPPVTCLACLGTPVTYFDVITWSVTL